MENNFIVTVTLVSKVKFQVKANSAKEAEEKAEEIEIGKIEEEAYSQGGTILGYEADSQPTKESEFLPKI